MMVMVAEWTGDDGLMMTGDGLVRWSGDCIIGDGKMAVGIGW